MAKPKYKLSDTRNIGIMPTSMPVRPRPSVFFYYTGKTHKIGEVHEGAACMD